MAKAAKAFRFIVTGQTRFPVDMLRYDRATPYSESDSNKLEAMTSQYSYKHDAFEIEMLSNVQPTVGRWASFGWKVKNIRSA